jgi:hypothetical protein
MAEVVGSEKILNYVAKYRFRKIKVTKGADVVYTDAVKANGEESYLLSRFETWINDFIEPDNFKEYKLELFGTNKEEAEVKQLTPVIKISIQFNHKEYMQPRNNFAGPGASAFDFKEYTALAVENAKLSSQLAQMAEKLNDLVEAQEEPKEASVTGKIGEVLLSRADDIISLLLMKFGGMQPAQGIAGITTEETINKIEDTDKWDNDILDLADEFKQINPDILSDLQKLLQLAKTNKPLFDMLIKQLRNM